MSAGRGIIAAVCSRFRDGWLDLLLPAACVHCGEDYGESGRDGLCDTCAKLLAFFSPPGCARCGWPGVSGTCRRCRRYPPPWRRLIALGWYEGALAAIVKAAKFGEQWRPLEWLWPELLARLPTERYDAVIAIPSDHALNERLADRLAECLACGRLVPLSRARSARRQVGLTRKERRANGPQLFRCAGERIPARVLLIDDLLTTGASVAAASELLRLAGATAIDVAVLARAPVRTKNKTQNPSVI